MIMRLRPFMMRRGPLRSAKTLQVHRLQNIQEMADVNLEVAGVPLDFIDIAIAHARLAAIPQERLINDWSEAKFLKWARGAWDR